MKKIIKRIPVLGKLAIRLKRKLRKSPKFESSENYWVDRYGSGGNSGVGSYNELAEYKGEIINRFVEENGIKTVIEHGCGDGNQLRYCRYQSFTGYEISDAALESCRKIHSGDPSKTFRHFRDYLDEKFDLSISLDVIYCVVEHELYEQYMTRLFNSSARFVIIYSTDSNKNDHYSEHIRHRKWSDWVKEHQPDFEQVGYIKNKFSGQIKPFVSDFYFFKRKP